MGKNVLAAWRAIMAANFLVDVSLPGEEAVLSPVVASGIDALSSG